MTFRSRFFKAISAGLLAGRVQPIGEILDPHAVLNCRLAYLYDAGRALPEIFAPRIFAECLDDCFIESLGTLIVCSTPRVDAGDPAGCGRPWPESIIIRVLFP